MNKADLGKELKALGREIVNATKLMKQSQEFKKLEKDLVSGVKSISSSVGKALKAAVESDSTKKLKRQAGRVVKAGTVEGKAQAEKLEAIASRQIRQASAAIKKMAGKAKNKQN